MASIHRLFTRAQQTEFERYGYVRLGKILPESQLQTMRDRLDGVLAIAACLRPACQARQIFRVTDQFAAATLYRRLLVIEQ